MNGPAARRGRAEPGADRRRPLALAAAFVVASGLALGLGGRREAPSVPFDGAAKVVVFGIPHVGLRDLDTGIAPNLDRMVARGALAAMTVRTSRRHPSTAEAYATLGAGTRVRSRATTARAFPARTRLASGVTVAATIERRTGRPVRGALAVLGGPDAVAANAADHLPSKPGALGEALHRAGRRTAVVGNADHVARDTGAPVVSRPAALALMDASFGVDAGTVDRFALLRGDPAAPAGVRFRPDAVLAAARRALARADVVVVDPGDLDRAVDGPSRLVALQRTDALLGRLEAVLPPRTLLLAAALTQAPHGHLPPLVAVGPGVRHGFISSASTRFRGVIVATDLAPTILGALGARVPDGMVGHALRAAPGPVDRGYLRRLERDAAFQARWYRPVVVGFVWTQTALYALLALALATGLAARGAPALRAALLAVAAFPLATFLLRAIPGVATLGSGALAVAVGLSIACAGLATAAVSRSSRATSWFPATSCAATAARPRAAASTSRATARSSATPCTTTRAAGPRAASTSTSTRRSSTTTRSAPTAAATTRRLRGLSPS